MKRIFLTLVSCGMFVCGFSQIGIFTPTNSGGFENGGSFTANNWTSVNGAANQWAVGSGSVNIGVRGAYIGNGTTYVGTNTFAINHFYRTAGSIIPANATSVFLSFRYRQPVVDPGGDFFVVSVGDNGTAPVPAVNTPLPVAYTPIYQNTATAYGGYVAIGPIDLTAYAGTTIRLVFTYINNGIAPIGIPAVDSIALYYCAEITSSTSPAVICRGGTVTFNCANSPTTGTWSSSNTAVATLSGTTATASTVNGAGVGTATITHTGGTCTVTRDVTVNPLPTTFSGTLSTCVGNNTTLTTSPSGGTWLSGAPSVATVGTSGIVSGIAAGFAGITYTLPTGCRTLGTVTVNSLPFVVNVTGGGSFCASGTGVPVGLDASAIGVNYDLSDGTSTVATMGGTGSAISFGMITTAGTYTVSATNATTGCSSNMSGSATVNVTAPVTPSIAISSSSSLICAGNSINFTSSIVNGGSTPTYQWFVNSIPASIASTYSYVPTDGDIISVTLTPGGICVAPASATDAMTLVVSPLSVPAVSIAVGPANPSCLGDPVTFTATPTLGGTSPGYRWTRNGINVATGPGYTFVPVSGDVVYCVMTSSFACRSEDTVVSSSIVMATQASAPLPVVNILAVPGTNVPDGTTVTLTALVVGGGAPVSYQWLVNGTIIPGETTPTLVSNSFVNGDIATCKVTNLDPCARFTLKSVAFSNGPSSVMTEKGAFADLKVLPNPNKGSFTLRGSIPSGQTVSINISNILGQNVYNSDVQSNTSWLDKKISLSGMSAGMYFINLKSDSENKLLHFIITE